MLYPLLAMIFGFTFVFGALLLGRVRTEVLFRERRSKWVRKLVLPEGRSGMSEMLAMGNYGAYVWSSFGLTLIVLVVCVIQGGVATKRS